MDPVVSVEPARLSVQPGGQGRVVVTIANPGSIVDGYTVEVLDEVSEEGGVAGPARWSQVLIAEDPQREVSAPPTVSVDVQQRAEVVVVFSPGTGPDVPGGTFAYAIRVRSVVDPSASAVAEGDVEIGRVFGLQAKLVPVGSTGRWSGNHVVSLSNWGNAPVRLRLVPSDPDQALGYLVRPEVVEVPLGGSASARVRVRTRRPRLRGQTARLPFSIVGEPDPPGPPSAGPTPVADLGRPVVDGAFTQKPILSRTVVSASALVLLGAVAATVFALTRPSGTPTVDVGGVPPTPVLAPAVPSGPDQIRLAWAPVANVSGYELQRLVPGKDVPEASEKVDKAVGAHVVKELEPGTEYCFVLLSLRGEVSSPPSAKTCARTTPVTPTTSTAPPGGTATVGPPTSSAPAKTTTPTTEPGTTAPTQSTSPPTGQSDGGTTSGPTAVAPGQWVESVFVFPAEAPLAEETARSRQALLATKGISANVLITSDFPGIRPAFSKASWIVYVGPFDSQAQAGGTCPAAATTAPFPASCLSIQPRP